MLQALLDGSRAVTITGPGGVGKTRFALAVAGEAAHAFPDGVWFVPLAALRDPALVLPTVGDTIGAEGDVARHIGDGASLLFLDNFEQIVDAAPELAALAGECPRLRLLVTSREALRIAVEREYPLSPLPESPSVELFRQRANAVAPEVEIEFTGRGDLRQARSPASGDRARGRALQGACSGSDPRPSLANLRPPCAAAAMPTRASRRCARRSSGATVSLGPKSSDCFAHSPSSGAAAHSRRPRRCAAPTSTPQSLLEKSLLRFTRGALLDPRDDPRVRARAA